MDTMARTSALSGLVSVNGPAGASGGASGATTGTGDHLPSRSGSNRRGSVLLPMVPPASSQAPTPSTASGNHLDDGPPSCGGLSAAMLRSLSIAAPSPVSANSSASACVLLTWGRGDDGQLGLGNLNSQVQPVLVPSFPVTYVRVPVKFLAESGPNVLALLLECGDSLASLWRRVPFANMTRTVTFPS